MFCSVKPNIVIPGKSWHDSPHNELPQGGYIDHDRVTRLVIGANGLMIAYFGNRIPKAFVPSAKARQIKRGAGAVFAGIAITIGYGLSLRGKAKAASRGL